MPIYTPKEIKSLLKPGLLKVLKGKSWFHIRTLGPWWQEEIASELDEGHKLRRKKGGI